MQGGLGGQVMNLSDVTLQRQLLNSDRHPALLHLHLLGALLTLTFSPMPLVRLERNLSSRPQTVEIPEHVYEQFLQESTEQRFDLHRSGDAVQ